MSIQNEIDRIKANVSAAYGAVAEKGGALPVVQNSDNLPAAIQNALGSCGSGSNPNLLRNGYFPVPVNRKGITSGSYWPAYSRGIDGWQSFGGNVTKWVAGEGVWLTGEREQNAIVEQEIEAYRIGEGVTVTLSALVDDDLYSGTWTVMAGHDYYQNFHVDTFGLRLEFRAPEGGPYLARVWKMFDGDILVKAVKLEFGDQQTLARQNADGAWELIDPPDYDLQYLLCSQYSPTTGEWVGIWHSNPNLLDNGDFRNPVNRNGESEYAIIGYTHTIDRWAFNNPNDNIAITDTGIKISLIAVSVFSQRLEKLPAGTYTLSFLFKQISDNKLSFVTPLGFFTPGDAMDVGDSGVKSCTFTITEPVVDTAIGLTGTGLENTFSTAEIIAAKLELGDQQTLARKNANGEWELIDPPNYPLQYLLCSQYSPATGEWIGSQHSNQNLLDNVYFADPINQRGQMEYAANGYTIDRWVLDCQNNDGSITLDADGILFHGGQEMNNWSLFTQRIERLAPGIYTLSFLVDDHTKLVQIYADGINAGLSFNSNLCSIQVNNTSERINHIVGIHVKSGETVKIYGAKLELGTQQTLAHKEGDTWVLNDPQPNKALELAKCQRYQIFGEMRGRKIWTHIDNYIGIFFPTPVSLRTTPTVIGNIEFLRTGSLDQYKFYPADCTIIQNGIYLYGSAEEDLSNAELFITDSKSGFDANL